MFTFRRNYFFLAILLFIIEVLIALFLHDRIVRPYVGDFLVVILLYCFVRAFFKVSVIKTAIIVLLFAYLIELLQYLNIIKELGLQNSKLANVVLGNLFEWIDVIAYTLGVITVVILEKLKASSGLKRTA
jgi:hypothetical protein